MSIRQTAAQEAVQMVPTGAVGGAILFGIPLSDLVLYVTLVVALLQGAFTIYKWRKYNGKSED